MGASSLRYALGEFVGGRIRFEVVEQSPNIPAGRNWDIDLLVDFCRRAARFARLNSATLGIDSWGVDHGFLGADGQMVAGPVMYRDPSHIQERDQLIEDQHQLFTWTGIAHQPFNTIYQLSARRKEDPWLAANTQWCLLPDLMNFMLTGVVRYEQTQASTTQLMGTDGRWCPRAFDLVGWPVPAQQPQPCGEIVGHCDGVPVVSVASHDTASAVLGVGTLASSDAYLNVGTWALLGTVLDRPCLNEMAESGGWTNEWGLGGCIRFLKNIPGLYVLNRLHDELGVDVPLSQWLDSRDTRFAGRLDQHDEALYNPGSMPEACSAIATTVPRNLQHWAQLGLMSLVECISAEVPKLAQTTGREFVRVRVVGGGSRSAALCQALANATGTLVVAGPDESTLLGNLAVQFLAVGAYDRMSLHQVVDSSYQTVEFAPGGAR